MDGNTADISSLRGRITGLPESVPDDVYLSSNEELGEIVQKISQFADIKSLFNEGQSKIELKKRYMLKSIDEVWVRAIEDTIPSLDLIIRHPGALLQEEEALLPIEQTRKVTGRSIQHLCQHTDLINNIKKDGTVTPTKLLNIYQDETILTYENKFINTLLVNLYAFVNRRYEMARACGEDEKMTCLDIDHAFAISDEERGKIHLSIEYSQKPHEHEVVKNYIYTSDLWKRVKWINKIVSGYMGSDFVMQMGKAYVRPPIMRTNKLLKNVDFRQCLALWEFIEQYENTGYETLVQEDLENVSEECLSEIYNTISMQYAIFRKRIVENVEIADPLDSRLSSDIIHPHIKDELDPFEPETFDYLDNLPAEKHDGGADDSVAEEPENKVPEDVELEDNIEEAIRVALAADTIFTEEEAEEEEAVIEDKKVVFRYRYSFLSRLIRAQDPTQTYYTEIKNELLAYENVTAKTVWSHESYYLGKTKCARVDVKGQTIFLYLALSPEEYETGEYHQKDVSAKKRTKDVPFLLLVRGERGVAHAKTLIASMMERLGAARLAEPTFVDYHLPLATNEEMAALEPPLVRIIPVEPEVPEVPEEPTEVLPPEPKFAYRYSFRARLILGGEPIQTLYEEIKNYLLSFVGVSSKMLWGYETFADEGGTVARVKAHGDEILLYLAVSPEEYKDTKFRLGAVGEKVGVFTVRNKRTIRNARELIDAMMRDRGAVQNDIPRTDYHMVYQTAEELAALAEPLVKKIPVGDKPAVADNGEVTKE